MRKWGFRVDFWVKTFNIKNTKGYTKGKPYRQRSRWLNFEICVQYDYKTEREVIQKICDKTYCGGIDDDKCPCEGFKLRPIGELIAEADNKQENTMREEFEVECDRTYKSYLDRGELR